MAFALAVFTLFGHGFLWVGIINRLHAIALPRRFIKRTTKIFFAIMGAGPLVLLLWWPAGWEEPFCKLADASVVHRPGNFLVAIYFVLCWIAGAGTIGRWLWHNFYFRRPASLLLEYRRHRAKILLEQAAIHPEEHAHHFTVRLPGNQSLEVEVAERSFEVPRLPAALHGLKILHLSDIHFTGRVGKAYFREVVRVSNELQPDLIALTGDYVDNETCIDWIPDTLGRLSARYGVHYVMGNHDTYINTSRLRKAMNACGMNDLGGRWMRLQIDNADIVLAGNELPWITPAADFTDCGPSSIEGGPVRIVLAHTPDQIGWARTQQVDLMLCGHTHGGQIRFPLVGAILAPSFHGVKFDYGLFYLPPTILQITRGISGKQPLRWYCPPEIALLTLHSPIV